MTAAQPATIRTASPGQRQAVRRPPAWLLVAAGLAATALTLAAYIRYAATHPMPDWMVPVDIRVYRFGGLIASHVHPAYQARRASPLYQWPGFGQLKFTYAPFAALVFIILTVPPWALLLKLSLAVNIALLVATIWVTLGAAGMRARTVRAGMTLLLTAGLFWLEPVQRVLFLGQVEIALTALVIWDMCQPDRRWWKGAGVGLAAGIKLTPLIFIPYLLITRRFRQAAVATGAFAATIAIGFAVMPADSWRWWLGGTFARGSRTGFVGWEGNQSLRGLITRLAGSVLAGQLPWLAAAAATTLIGLACAAALHRAGHPLPGLLACALTGILVSPISWDHHWIWIVPIIAGLAGYAVQARGLLRWAYAGAALLLAGIFGGWPGSLWGMPNDLGGFSLGFIWAPPNTSPGTYYKRGDRPSFVEYHWHGFQLITGNLYILTGLAMFAAIAVLAVRSRRPRN